MKKTEAERLRQEIQTKNLYLRQMRRWLLVSTMIAIVGILIAYWGFSGMSDPFLPNVSVAARQPWAWIFTAVGACSAFFSLLVLVGLINGRKHVLSLLDELEGKATGKPVGKLK